MQELATFFETLDPKYRSLLLVVGLVFFWVLEGTVPLFRFDYMRVRHAAVNLTLTFFQLIVAVLLGTLMVKLCQFTTEREFGLFYLLPIPFAVHVVLGFLLLDLFGGYTIHRIEHMIKRMWRFHVVHHADTHVDVTTGLRHHPVETIFRLSAQAAAVLIGGIPIGVVLMYSVGSVFFAQLTHANIRTPIKIDRVLAWIFVTPRMHKVHHHASKPLTNTNYGNIFSIWDRVFGTFVDVDSDSLHYGLDSLPADSQDNVSGMLAIPFAKRNE